MSNIKRCDMVSFGYNKRCDRDLDHAGNHAHHVVGLGNYEFNKGVRKPDPEPEPEPKYSEWEICPKSGQQRFEVPGGWIYQVDWQYDVSDIQPSVHGCSMCFVPNL